MARNFNGTNQWFTAANGYLLDYPFTISVWFRDDSDTGDDHEILELWETTSASIRVSLDNSGNFSGYVRDGGGAVYEDDGALSDSNWHHGVYQGASTTDRNTFFDGGSGSNYTASEPMPGALGNLEIGREPGGADYWDGDIAEIAIWDAELSVDDVAMLAEGYSAFFRPENLVCYIPMTEESGPVRDIVSGTVFTENGTILPASHPRIIMPSRQIFVPVISAGGGTISAAGTITMSAEVSAVAVGFVYPTATITFSSQIAAVATSVSRGTIIIIGEGAGAAVHNAFGVISFIGELGAGGGSQFAQGTSTFIGDLAADGTDLGAPVVEASGTIAFSGEVAASGTQLAGGVATFSGQLAADGFPVFQYPTATTTLIGWLKAATGTKSISATSSFASALAAAARHTGVRATTTFKSNVDAFPFKSCAIPANGLIDFRTSRSHNLLEDSEDLTQWTFDLNVDYDTIQSDPVGGTRAVKLSPVADGNTDLRTDVVGAGRIDELTYSTSLRSGTGGTELQKFGLRNDAEDRSAFIRINWDDLTWTYQGGSEPWVKSVDIDTDYPDGWFRLSITTIPGMFDHGDTVQLRMIDTSSGSPAQWFFQYGAALTHSDGPIDYEYTEGVAIGLPQLHLVKTCITASINVSATLSAKLRHHADGGNFLAHGSISLGSDLSAIMIKASCISPSVSFTWKAFLDTVPGDLVEGPIPITASIGISGDLAASGEYPVAGSVGLSSYLFAHGRIIPDGNSQFISGPSSMDIHGHIGPATINGEKQAIIDVAFGSLQLYNNSAGAFYTIGGGGTKKEVFATINFTAHLDAFGRKDQTQFRTATIAWHGDIQFIGPGALFAFASIGLDSAMAAKGTNIAKGTATVIGDVEADARQAIVYPTATITFSGALTTAEGRVWTPRTATVTFSGNLSADGFQNRVYASGTSTFKSALAADATVSTPGDTIDLQTAAANETTDGSIALARVIVYQAGHANEGEMWEEIDGVFTYVNDVVTPTSNIGDYEMKWDGLSGDDPITPTEGNWFSLAAPFQTTWRQVPVGNSTGTVTVSIRKGTGPTLDTANWSGDARRDS